MSDSVGDTSVPDDARLMPAALTEALRGSGALASGRRVVAVRSQPLGSGKAMMSMLLRLHLEYDEPFAGPSTIVAKLACEDPFRRSVADRFNFYDREVFFYERLAPSMPFRVPGCHLAVMDPVSSTPVILLEDLGDLSVSQTAGCAWEQATLVAGELARFHAQWWGRTAALADDVHAVTSPSYLENVKGVFSESWPSCRRLAGDRIPPELLAIGDRWADGVADELVAEIADPMTLCHGDLRLDNLRFVDGALVVFDFQLLVRGNGVADLAYFASQSIPTPIRSGRDHELIDLYLRQLARAGVQYDRRAAWQAYRAATLFMFLFPVVLYKAFDELPPAGQDLAATMLDRSAAAIRDTQACSVVSGD
jgi:hypothetical protein